MHSFRNKNGMKKRNSWYTRQENTVRLSSMMSDRKVYCHTSEYSNVKYKRDNGWYCGGDEC